LNDFEILTSRRFLDGVALDKRYRRHSLLHVKRISKGTSFIPIPPASFAEIREETEKYAEERKEEEKRILSLSLPLSLFLSAANEPRGPTEKTL